MADDLFGYREEQRTRSFDNCQPRGKEIEKCTVVLQLVPFFIDGTEESLQIKRVAKGKIARNY